MLFMSIFIRFFRKIKRTCLAFLFCPIDVYVFHSVSEKYESVKWWDCDWTQINVFKDYILRLNKQNKFISLPDALNHLKHDVFRFKKYAVLTSDDGYSSVLSVLPWLKGNDIPITLFINAKYLDGRSWSPINEEQVKRAYGDDKYDMDEIVNGLYITKEQLFGLTYDSITIGLHGYEHNDASKMTAMEFEANLSQSLGVLKNHPRYIPFYAYTWGRFTDMSDHILHKHNIIPVRVSGKTNYVYNGFIDRTCIDGCI